MSKKTNKSKAGTRVRAKPKQSDNAAVRLPPPYRNGRLPTLAPRNEIISLVQLDGPDLHTQPTSVSVTKLSADTARVDLLDPAVARLMIEETHQRDRWVDMAFAEILSVIEGKPLTADLLSFVRTRMRQLGDDIHCLARVGVAVIAKRERSKSRSRFDAVDVCREIKKRSAAGVRVTDAFLEVAGECGVAVETIRNAYYKHRHLATD
jgi:hypothetical protein